MRRMAEVISAERQDPEERTVVDVLDRPNHEGVWEEIWHATEHIPMSLQQNLWVDGGSSSLPSW